MCSPGNCRTDADCPTGEICGLEQANVCGQCTADGQCEVDATYGPTTICDTSTGKCGSNACTSNDKACPANKSDFCCTGACVPGNCCVTADCTGANQTCQGHTCTTCGLATNNTYYVDPKNGDDARATGSSATGGACAFQTITRALQFIGPSPAVNTKIEVLPTATVQSGEQFPISVPLNVTIQGATTGSPTTVDVPADDTAFTLSAASSGLDNLIVDGTQQAGTSGILVTTGSAATTTLTNVEVRNMASDGIDVKGTGVLAIGTNTQSHNNGTAAAPSSGLVISQTGQATITVNTGDVAAHFDDNTEFGIDVFGNGSVTIGGTLSPAATGNSNDFAGLYVFQTPGNTLPPNDVTNFQALNSGKGNGIHVFGGSQLKLRSSQLGGNPYDGIEVETYVNGTTKSDDMSGIDLGTATSAGNNVLQYAAGGAIGPNGGAGICLSLTATASQTLSAEGNTFGGTNCATKASMLTTSATCAGATDVGVTGTATTNKIDTTKCQN